MGMMQMRFVLSTGADVTYSKNISDAHLTRLMNAQKTRYALPQSTTVAQIVARIGEGTFNHLKSSSMEQERSEQQPTIEEYIFT